MKKQKEFNFDFFKKNKQASDIEVGSSDKVQLQKIENDHKIKKMLISAFVAIIGLIGISCGIEYSGWLIFLAFVIS